MPKKRKRKVHEGNIYPESGAIRGLIRIVRNLYGPDASPEICKGRVLLASLGRNGEKNGTCKWCGQPCGKRRKWHGNCVRYYLAARGSVVPPHYEKHKGPEWERVVRHSALHFKHKHRPWIWDLDGFIPLDLVNPGFENLTFRSALYDADLHQERDFDRAPREYKFVCCAECHRGYQEVDHRLALSIAWELRKRGDRHWYRAWMPSNLRPLCPECHGAKTRADRAELARLKRGPKTGSA